MLNEDVDQKLAGYSSVHGCSPARRRFRSSDEGFDKAGAMSEVVGKGEVSVDINISEIDVPAGAPLLSLSTMLPGLSKMT